MDEAQDVDSIEQWHLRVGSMFPPVVRMGDPGINGRRLPGGVYRFDMYAEFITLPDMAHAR